MTCNGSKNQKCIVFRVATNTNIVPPAVLTAQRIKSTYIVFRFATNTNIVPPAVYVEKISELSECEVKIFDHSQGYALFDLMKQVTFKESCL